MAITFAYIIITTKESEISYILEYFSLKNILLTIGLVTGIYLIVILATSIIIVLEYIYIKGFNIRKSLEYRFSDDTYQRDLIGKYSPAVASYLVNIDRKYDNEYIALILNMIHDNKIKAVKTDNRIEYIATDSDIWDLSSHEKYIYNKLINKEKISNIEFENELIKDCEHLNLLEFIEKPKYLSIVFVAIGVLLYVASSAIKDLNEILYTIFTICLFIAVVASIYFKISDKNMIRKTREGKIEATKWKNFARYIRHFTLIKEKNLEDVILYDKYLIYGIALGEANKIDREDINKLMYVDIKYDVITYR